MNKAVKTGMRPSHPGAFFCTEVLEELGLTISRVAEILGVRRATVSDLIHGKAAVTPEMALRIEKAFGISMDMLLKMQAWFDADAMRRRADEIVVERFVPDGPAHGLTSVRSTTAR